ncbi:Notchless-like protein 1 [Aphelenchoides bicaudatus]|nr:Notchless-like protein 1 [Aphelenchoides bicaudatus]
MDVDENKEEQSVTLRIFAEDGSTLNDAPILIPFSTSVDELQGLCNQLLNQEEDDQLPIQFQTVDGVEIINSIKDSIPADSIDEEKGLVNCLFATSIVSCSTCYKMYFKMLASGSGDKTVRLWDLTTELPFQTCEGHPNWVLCIAFSPNGKKLASACKSGEIFIWDPNTGKQLGRKLIGHKQWINALAWAPLHEDPESRHLASAGKDGTIRIWDTITQQTVRVLSGHTSSVTCVRWGGCGFIYSGSQEAKNVALERYKSALNGKTERLVSGSDDFTLFMWDPTVQTTPIARLTGHQQLINQVAFSPDTRLLASASFDKSIRIWCGSTGRFLKTLRGHVQAVYQLAWSADSRLLVSGSADSTLKVWNMQKKELMLDLPGHGADVFAVDWSPDGERVASGGKDCVLKLWRQ